MPIKLAIHLSLPAPTVVIHASGAVTEGLPARVQKGSFPEPVA